MLKVYNHIVTNTPTPIFRFEGLFRSSAQSTYIFNYWQIYHLLAVLHTLLHMSAKNVCYGLVIGYISILASKYVNVTCIRTPK